MKKLIFFYGVLILACFGFLMQESPLQQSVRRGNAIYTDFCITCHLANGKGAAGIYPPLAGSDYLMQKRNESIKAVKLGQQGAITVNGKTYNGIMPPMGLTDEEVADVLNYILNSWGNTSEKMVSPEEVAEIGR